MANPSKNGFYINTDGNNKQQGGQQNIKPLPHSAANSRMLPGTIMLSHKHGNIAGDTQKKGG